MGDKGRYTQKEKGVVSGAQGPSLELRTFSVLLVHPAVCRLPLPKGLADLTQAEGMRELQIVVNSKISISS